MFEELAEAVGLVRAGTSRLDASDLGALEARQLLRVCAELSCLAQAGAALAAARVEATGAYRAARARSAKGYVSSVCGISVTAAEAMIELGQRLERFGATRSLLLEATISPAEADQVTRAATRNPAAEQSLLDAARTESFSRLRERANAVQSPDPDSDRRRARAAREARSVRTWTDADGVGHLHAKGPVDLIGILTGRIDARAEVRFGAARSSGDHQPPGSYRFDALVDLICGIPPVVEDGAGAASSEVEPPDSAVAPDPDGQRPVAVVVPGDGRGDLFGTGAPDDGAHPPPDRDETVPGLGPAPPRARRKRRKDPRPRVDMVIRVDFSAIRRGYVEGDETCEVAGIGPISVAAATEYLGAAALKFILTDGVDIRAVAHAGRHVNSHLRSALTWQYRRCSAPGCDRSLGLQRDHQFPVGKGGWTSLENLQLLCRSCHEEKTKRDYPNGTAYLRGRRNRQPAA
jgi:hypothetical protein